MFFFSVILKCSNQFCSGYSQQWVGGDSMFTTSQGWKVEVIIFKLFFFISFSPFFILFKLLSFLFILFSFYLFNLSPTFLFCFLPFLISFQFFFSQVSSLSAFKPDFLLVRQNLKDAGEDNRFDHHSQSHSAGSGFSLLKFMKNIARVRNCPDITIW